ncbi:Protein of unknown function [Quadrisphaera granulorum]|uniref:DUF3027 family protein n=1 Tax=Quadrisphaera granulorum TaxID=317664 RepID=A0A316AYB8_9ACTN|nr:DUF3027 domain-containing protein [Quadrisphaera granulorum]PWJ55207.1 Protein of unknown function (DUF3027) [Quadrisphaera granulorum]SZE95716.1 Protein of unknown function [Quadrisphaera granulorum]
MPATRTRRPVLDAVSAAAVDLARQAAEEVSREASGGSASVGDHLGAHAEGDRVVVHRFASTDPGYVDWAWTVVVARASRAKAATVSEVALLPEAGAVLAPAWLPWDERLRPGDVGPHDVLPRIADDPRLEPGYTAVALSGPDGEEQAEVDRVALWELGLGRPRVLSAEGRDDAATRWYTGSHGPTAEQARASASPCASCGFYLRLAGPLSTVFGVCANEWSPSDGSVVSVDHGCGAHSETDVVIEPEPRGSLVLDERGVDPI